MFKNAMVAFILLTDPVISWVLKKMCVLLLHKDSAIGNRIPSNRMVQLDQRWLLDPTDILLLV